MSAEVEASTQAFQRSSMTYRIGGHEYPLYTNPLCKTCRSPYRFDVEEQLISGRTYGNIIKHLPDDADVSIHSLKRHVYGGHLPLQQSAVRSLIEERAQRVGKRIEAVNEELVDGISFLNVVVLKGFEAIAAGAPVEVPEAIRAAKILAEYGEYDAAVNQEAYVEAYTIFHEEAARIMTPEQHKEFSEALGKNQTLQTLAARFDGEVEEAPAEESEAEDT